MNRLIYMLLAASLCNPSLCNTSLGQQWPPPLDDAVGGVVNIKTKDFLVAPALTEPDSPKTEASYLVAKEPPAVDLAFHAQLGPDAIGRRLWSSWGDICVADDGTVYCGIGDHGNAVGGDARCFLHHWDPRKKTLNQVVDMNQVVPPRDGQPAWSKIHARIDQGPDGKIYFSATLNDGNRAKQPEYRWNSQLPGGQLYQFDPATGKTTVFANLPPRRCTATSILDRQRSIWWCNLESGEGDALWGLDMKTGKPIARTADGSVGFNRNFALTKNGEIIFNGDDGAVRRYDPSTKSIATTKSKFPDSPGMRCSTRQSSDGYIYGITHKTSQLFRYDVAHDDLRMLGPNWRNGSYTTVCMLSPDERYLYYLPGSHGKAYLDGTPVVQYEIDSGKRKVIAFLVKPIEDAFGYVPAGTYGAKLNADGSTIFVNFNGHATDRKRPNNMRANGFGLCAFAAIHIPPSER